MVGISVRSARPRSAASKVQPARLGRLPLYSRIRAISRRGRTGAELGGFRTQKKGAGYGAFVETRVDLGGLAGKVSFSRRDIDRHAVVDEARGGDLHQIERARLSQAVEVPCEFAAVRSESNDFIVTHVDPLGFVV